MSTSKPSPPSSLSRAKRTVASLCRAFGRRRAVGCWGGRTRSSQTGRERSKHCSERLTPRLGVTRARAFAVRGPLFGAMEASGRRGIVGKQTAARRERAGWVRGWGWSNQEWLRRSAGVTLYRLPGLLLPAAAKVIPFSLSTTIDDVMTSLTASKLLGQSGEQQAAASDNHYPG